MDARRKRVCIIVSTPLIVHFFLRQHLHNVAARFNSTLVTGSPDETLQHEYSQTVQIVALPIERDISPLRDLVALWGLLRLLRRSHFDLVHTITPKAGLLGMIAAWIARVPIRLHTFQGQVWLTRRGVMRQLLRSFDRLVARLSTHLLAVSPSERTFLIEDGIVPMGKVQVIGYGSATGVDLRRFKADSEVRTSVRESLGVPLDARVVLFVGRLTRDKGVFDLAEAFKRLAVRRPDVFLLFIGPDEEGLEPKLRETVDAHQARVRFIGYTHEPERFFAAADILSLPSYREGFGNVIIEAAACAVPAIAARIYGITDAVIDSVTGLLHTPGDTQELATMLERLIDDEALRTQLGQHAQKRVKREFTQELVCGALLHHYEALLYA
jgi:glycosyltransferase involved in cell wall biosynthesis